MSVKVGVGLSGFSPVVASGGTVSDVNVGGTAYRVHTFLSSGDFVVESAGSTGEVEYLVVAGGGGGSQGGGGGGGLLSGSYSAAVGTASVVVGAGGAAGNPSGQGAIGTNGSSGDASSVFGVSATGGGGGGAVVTAGLNGGSGGGGGASTSATISGGSGIAGQGFDGSSNGGRIGAPYPAGAGGGAGETGSAPFNNTVGGVGGDGAVSSITGTPVVYAGGGGGGVVIGGTGGAGGDGGGGDGGGGGTPGQAGTDGLGGGGGGGGQNAGGGAGDGGDGVVIIRYPLTTDITGNTTSVSVTRGRRDETEPFQTGRATLTVRNLDGTYDPEGTPFQLRDPVTVSWEGNGTAVPVFTGFVEDVTLGYDLSGDAQVQVSCVDGFALLANQTIVDEAVSVEDSGARIGTVLANSGVAWPAGTAIATGISQLAAGTADGNALQYLRQVEESEQGYLYVARDGTLTFKNRHTTLNNPIAGTQFSDDGGGIPYEAVERFSGARSLFNKVTGELEDGTAREANDATSQSDFSIRTLDLGTVLLESVTTLEDFVEYLLNQFATPATRVDALTVNLDRLSESDAEKLASFELADICDVEFTPPGRSQFTNQLLVQGVQHRVTVGGAWRVDLSFQRRDTRSFLILDDSVQGTLDDNLLGF